MGKSLNMNYVNCALLVVVLIIVVMCYKKQTEEFGKFGDFFKKAAKKVSGAADPRNYHKQKYNAWGAVHRLFSRKHRGKHGR